MGVVHRKLPHILSDAILRIQFESAVNKTIFSMADYCGVNVVFSSQCVSCHANSILCIDLQGVSTTDTVLLLKSTSNEPTVQSLKFMKGGFSGLNLKKLNKKCIFHDNMFHKI